jgi:tyrosine-protein kinase Etk/Wzc
MSVSTANQDSEKAIISRGSVLTFIELIARARRFVIIASVCAAIVSGVISILLPRMYESTMSFLPPRESGPLSSLGSLTSALSSVSPLRSIGGLAGARSSNYNYLSILASRNAKEAIIRKFDLMRVYEISDSSMEKTMKTLDDFVAVDVAEEGHISVTVLDTDPQRAANMANYYAVLLNSINAELTAQSSGKYREFLEKGVREAKDSLRIYEEAYKNFQKKSGFVPITEDVKGGAQAIAQLYAEKATRELEVQFLRSVVGKDNPELMRRELELNILNQKVATIPDLGLESLRLYRSVLIQSKILEVLLPLYEQARLEEKKETPSAAVLDKAVPAEKKARPKRMLIVLISTLSVALLSFSFYALRDRFRKFKGESPEHYEILRSVFRRTVK